MTRFFNGCTKAAATSALMALLLSACSSQPQGPTARDLFYHDLNGNHAQSNQSTSVEGSAANAAYRLELTRGDDPPVMVNNGFTFKAGDKVRIYIKVSSPVYAYVLSTGSSGKKSLLYPPAGEDNHLEAGREYPIPSQGVLEFDNNPGTEHLLVALSRQPLEENKALELSGPALSPELLTGKPGKLGDYSVLSNPSDSLVYVNNPNADKPIIIELALNHNQSGDALNGSHGVRKIRYSVPSLTGEVEDASGLQEAVVAMIPSEIDGGERDQYITGLNHLYANYLLQTLSPTKFYTQEEGRQTDTNDNGETVRKDSFTGDPVSRGYPGECATIDGIAFIEENFSKGRPNFVVGEFYKSNSSNNKIYWIRSGQELDQAWEANHKEPLIAFVSCKAKMFGGGAGSHVLVLADRRESNKPGRTSKYQYLVNNSWGKQCNGWAGADNLVCAINYDRDPQHDESTPPERSQDPDELQPPPEGAKYARGDDGIIVGDDERKSEWSQIKPSIFGDSREAGEDPSDPDAADESLYSKSAADEVAELKQHINDDHNGMSADEKSVALKAIDCILSNTKDDGSPRRTPIAPKQQSAIFHEANRLFNEESKVTAQGLEQRVRNRALVAMLHDIANPNHINQGYHNTCNVTTIAKIECFKRPARQAKQFVDMYTNFNGDQTVNMPP